MVAVMVRNVKASMARLGKIPVTILFILTSPCPNRVYREFLFFGNVEMGNGAALFVWLPLLLGLGRGRRRHRVLALDVVLGAIGVAGALVGALAGEAFQFAGAPGVRPCAFAGTGAVLAGGDAAREANERLVAVVHGDDHVPAVLPFFAADIAGDDCGLVLGFQARHFEGRGPGARQLEEHQCVAGAVADVDRLLLIGLAAFAIDR